MTREEAIQILRTQYPHDAVIKEALGLLIPELRESEDERARKAVLEGIEYLERKLGWDAIGDTDILDVKEYLEKQKEHHIPWYDYQKSKEAVYTIVPNEEYEQLIKQKEQKPEDKEITLTNFEEVLNTFLFDFANSPIEDCEPKEYTKKHSAEILKAAYAELNAQLKQDIFEAQQEGRREGYEAAKAEQKPAEIDFEDWDTLGYIRDIVRKHVRRDEEFNVLDKWLTEHYVNQKPADKEQDSIAFLEQHGYTIIPPHAPVSIVSSSKVMVTKWSEDDEKNLKQCIEIVRGWEIDYDYANPHYSNWLKSISSNLKKKNEDVAKICSNEWSEEDEKMVRFYVDDYDNNLGNMPMREVIENRIKFKDWLINRLKYLHPQPCEEIYHAAKHGLAIKFMNYLDENRPEGKMSLSNGECEDIDKAFKENDWTKIMRYVGKYRTSWKPSEEQMEALKFAVKLYKNTHFENNHERIVSLYEQLKKLM